MTTMIDIKNISILNTVSVCGYYIYGSIDVMPKCHVDKMLKELTRDKIRFSKLGAADPKILDCVSRYENDIMLMIDSYLKLIQYRREAARKHYKNSFTAPTFNKSVRTIRTITDVMVEYYIRIADYFIGSIDFEGGKLDIYYNVPPKSKHYSLTCFHTNPESLNQYFFKNLDNMLPSEELTDEFLLQLPNLDSQNVLSKVSTISKLTDETLLKLPDTHNQDLLLDDYESTHTVTYSF